MELLIKKIIVLLTSIVNASNRKKCVSLNYQKCVIQPTLINLHPNEYSQESHYYPLEVKSDRCVRNCGALKDLSNKACDRNKTEDIIMHVFNMITRINE